MAGRGGDRPAEERQSPPFHFRPISAPGRAPPGWEPEHIPPEQGFGAAHSVAAPDFRTDFPERQAGWYYGQPHHGVRISIQPMQLQHQYQVDYQYETNRYMAPPPPPPPPREVASPGARLPFFAPAPIVTPAPETLSGNPFGGDVDGERSDARFAMFVYKVRPPTQRVILFTMRVASPDCLRGCAQMQECSTSAKHDWKACPFRHVGEEAGRRHPSAHSATPCQVRKSTAPVLLRAGQARPRECITNTLPLLRPLSGLDTIGATRCRVRQRTGCPPLHID